MAAPRRSSTESPADAPARHLSAGTILLIVAGAIFVWFTIDLLLLVFAGILLAVFLRTLSLWLCNHTRLSNGWSLVVVIVVLLGLAALFWRVTAPELGRQVDQLTKTLPEAVERATDWLDDYGWGRWITGQARTAVEGDRGSGAAGGRMVATATGIASSLVRLVVTVAVVLFIGVYLAADPEPYRRGFLRLLPKDRRLRGAEVLEVLGYTLRWWLFGQLIAMAGVGVLMGVGLSILGVPLALVLGMLAGLLEFIPTFGPPLALVPALLLGMQQGTDTFLWVLGLYAVVQTAESYLLTPLIQQRAVELPPVLTITAQVLLGVKLGALGLLVAVPLTAVLLVLVKMLYVQEQLGDDLEVAGEEQAEEDLRAHADNVPGV